jgi:hypothetical protein
MTTQTHSTHRERLKRFLYDKVENLEELAILAWLRVQGTAALPIDVIAAEVQLPVSVSALALEQLHRRGLVWRSESLPRTFRFQADNAETSELVELLMAAYERDPASLMALMGSSAIERIRSAAWQTFADCVRLSAKKPPKA